MVNLLLSRKEYGKVLLLIQNDSLKEVVEERLRVLKASVCKSLDRFDTFVRENTTEVEELRLKLKAVRSIARLNLSELGLIRTRGRTLQELEVRVQNQLTLNRQLRNECEILTIEKCDLNAKRKVLQERCGHIEKQCKELEQQHMMLMQVIRDQQTKLARLEEMVHAKMQLLQNFSSETHQRLNNLAVRSVASYNDLLSTASPESPRLHEDSKKLALADVQEQKALMQAGGVYSMHAAQKCLTLFHIETQQSYSFLTVENKQLIDYASLQLADTLYVGGGFNPQREEYVASMFQYQVLNCQALQIMPLEKMCVSKSLHTMVALNPNTLYSIGGRSKGHKCINVCERYSAEEGKWELASPLNEKKQQVAAAGYELVAIYVFGGFHEEVLRTIEVLRPHENNRWHIIKTTITGWTPRKAAGCVQSSANEILVFGGSLAKSEALNDVFVFNPNVNSGKKLPHSLSKADWFTGTPVLSNSIIYVRGTIGNCIHIFDIQASRWNLLAVPVPTLPT